MIPRLRGRILGIGLSFFFVGLAFLAGISAEGLASQARDEQARTAYVCLQSEWLTGLSW